MAYRTHVVMDTALYTARLANISSASTCFIPILATGIIKDSWGTIANAITNANATITVAVQPGGTGAAVTIGTIVITQVGSAAGSTFQMSLATTGTEINRTVNAGDCVTFTTDAGSSTSCEAYFGLNVDDI